jgi:hypothetical protein
MTRMEEAVALAEGGLGVAGLSSNETVKVCRALIDANGALYALQEAAKKVGCKPGFHYRCVVCDALASEAVRKVAA